MTKTIDSNIETDTTRNLKALPAEYEFTNENPDGINDDIAYRLHPEIVKDKFTYGATKYDYPDRDGRGYSFMHHDPLKSGEDEAFANHTYVGLHSNGGMSSLAVREKVDVLNLVLFTSLKAPNGKYLKNVGGRLYAITEPGEILTDANMFKIYRSVYSMKGYDIHHPDDVSYVISQDQKFATVKMFMNRFNIEMQDLIGGDPTGIQHYRVYQIPGTNRISIYSMMTSPWEATVDNATSETTAGARILDTLKDVHRFWSIYDGASTDLVKDKMFPSMIYESQTPHPNMVKINGNIFNSKYSGVDTLRRVGNNYLFEAGYLADGNDRYIMLGYDGKIRWVKYFNEFYDKFFNSDVTPDKIIEDVTPSILHECPYESVMGANGFKLNFVELKNVMTPGYAYTAVDKPKLK